MAKPVGAFQLFKPSKEAVLNNFVGFLFIVFLPAFLILIGDAMNLRDYFASPDVKLGSAEIRPESAPYYFLGAVLSVVLLPAGFYLELQAAKGKTLDVAQAFSDSLKYFWRILGLVLLVGLIVLIGLVAFIVPGLIFITRYFLAPYFLIDKNMGIKEAMSASSKASKGYAGAIWGVIGVTILLSLFQVIPIWGGLIALMLTTLYTCAPAMRYLELSKTKLKNSPVKK